MTETLSMILLGAISVIVGLVVMLIIYLVDRFNTLERDTQALIQNLSKSQSGKEAGPFAGLSGKPLWDAMSGAAPPDIDDFMLEMVRERYRAVLRQHLFHIFKEGTSDGKNGFDAVPANSRLIKTQRGQVESWLPPNAVSEVYKAGQGFGRNDPAELPGVRASLDVVYGQLHEQCGLELLQSGSSLLMSPSVDPAAAPGDPALAAPSKPPAT